MKLPDIDYAAPVQESSSAIARVSQAQRQALDTVGAGLQALSAEMIKTQSQKAGAAVEAGMAADEADLSSQRYVPVAQVKAELGDAFEQLPQDIREHREIVDDGKGGQVEVVPTYLVAGALFDKRTKTRIEEASKNIPGQGWQAAFQDAALADLTQRKRGLAVQQAHAMVEDFKQTQLATVDQYLRGGAWDQALATIDHSDALSPGEKAQQREQVLATKQRAEAAGAKMAQAAQVEATSSAILQTARIPGYAWVDPAKALAAVDALPASDPAKNDVRKLVEHQVDQAEQLREQAGKQQLNRAQALVNRGASLAGAQLAPIKTWMLDPANGAAGLWDALERGVRAEQRANRSLANTADAEARRLAIEERRQQAALNQEALYTFQALPLGDRVKVDPDTTYPDVDRVTKARIRAEQQKADQLVKKGLEVPHGEFQGQVKAAVQGLEKEDQATVIAYMDRWYWGEVQAPRKEGQPVEIPGQVQVTKALADAMTKVDVKWGTDRARALVDDPRSIRGPLPPEEQTYEPSARAIAAGQGQQAAAPSPAKAAPSFGAADAARIQAAWKARFPNRPPLTPDQVQRALAAERGGQ